MIHKIIFNDKSKLFHHWINELEYPGEIEFKPGTNVIIGENGCGKTSLLNIIRNYTMCSDKYYTSDFKKGQSVLKNAFTEDFQNGADVIANYNKPTFNLRTSDMLNHYSGLENTENFVQTYTKLNSSSGEDTWFAMNELTKIMFIEDHVSGFNMIDNLTDDEIKSYYIRNNIKDSTYTILMDEPDKGVDIDKLDILYNILVQDRLDIQFIICIHNPALIYKLYKTKKCNFIELSKGYLRDVLDFLK